MRAGRDPDLDWPEEPSACVLGAHFFGAVLALALPIALAFDHTYAIGRTDAADRALVLLGLLLGPLTGWLLGGSTLATDWYHFVNAVTGLTAGPLVLVAGSRSRAAIALAAPFWVLGGYIFSVAIWI